MSTEASTGIAASTGDLGSTGDASTGIASTGFVGWGDDWRDRMVAGSTDVEKDRKLIERYESPEQVWKKGRQFEVKLSAGELRSTLPPNATPDELKTWRVENGIPENPEGYKITMPQGRQAPEEDDPFLKGILADFHEANYTQAQVDRALLGFYREVDRQVENTAEEEKKKEQECEDTLRGEWGPADYRANKTMAENLLNRAPEGFRDRFMNGYFADHMPIRSSPEAWRWLVQMEREINPFATIVPAGAGDFGKRISEEKKELLKNSQAPKNSPEWKSYWVEGGDKRYNQLVEAEQKAAKKTGEAA